MLEKHPDPLRPMGEYPTTDQAPLSVSTFQVCKAALSFNKGSAGGTSGLRPEHLKVVLQASNARRESAAAALTKLVNRMLAGKVPSHVAPFLCGARLHAGLKKDGSLRPIAVGDILRRLTSKCAAAATADKASAFLAPLQLGVGVRNGCEAIIHATRQAIEKAPEKFVLRADLVNAFNLADRAAALQEAAQHFPELLPWLSTSYGAPSLLIFSSTSIWSKTGVHQGDPLASLGFSLVLRPLTMKIQDSVPSLDLNTWFLDDGTLVGTIPELRQAVDIFQETGPSRGLILSTTHTARVPKTTLWCSTDVTGNNDPLDRGVPRVRGLGITLLGAPLGHTGYESEFIRQKIDKIRQITSLLPDLQDAHSEFSLLRSCLSLP
ncbi:MAG: reverse transcriptase domain-containing protein, partial [Cyanobacteriota bacterium]|nr:reverse transcriptase domain-containing protein [Cyanobacteriota bacterium]